MLLSMPGLLTGWHCAFVYSFNLGWGGLFVVDSFWKRVSGVYLYGTGVVERVCSVHGVDCGA